MILAHDNPPCSQTLLLEDAGSIRPPDESEGTISLKVVLRIGFAAHTNIIATTPGLSSLESRCDQTSYTHSCIAASLYRQDWKVIFRAWRLRLPLRVDGTASIRIWLRANQSRLWSRLVVGQAALEPPRDKRGREQDRKVDQGHDRIHLERPIGLGVDQRRVVDEVRNRNDGHQ